VAGFALLPPASTPFLSGRGLQRTDLALMSDPASPRPDFPRPESAAPDPAVTTARRLALNEDWAATVVGLLLLVLVLTGLLPGWLVP